MSRIIKAATPGAAIVPALALVVLPAAAHAYVGPGAGLTAIGTVIALLAAVVLAIVGFVWYPVKRMLGKKRSSEPASTSYAVKDNAE